MEVNKEEAGRCRDLGAEAIRRGQNARAVKMLAKSLRLYPLPGVKALLGQAERRMRSEEAAGGGGAAGGNENSNATSANGTSNGGRTFSRPASSASMGSSSSSAPAAPSATAGADGRTYTPAQADIVSRVLASRAGGRGAHYRVLGVEANCDDAALKKSYRKLALKLHPDKNSAPKADEAFKAVGLAYGTLSDAQKRRIYDHSGEEDPDNRGGGMRRGPGGAHFQGQDVSPEDIFNMFFGGGMAGGMGGQGGMGGDGRARVSSFGGMHPNMRARQQQQRGQQRQQQQQPEGILGQLVQLLPLFLIMLLSFWNMTEDGSSGGENGYFSLTPVRPHVNPLRTKLTKVRDIPYYVSDQFLRTIARDKYQLGQVERMVEKRYERYLVTECEGQRGYRRKLEMLARQGRRTEAERTNLEQKARGFELTRCVELEDLFPGAVPPKDRAQSQRQQQQRPSESPRTTPEQDGGDAHSEF
ncbi:hypothetical protein ACHAWF_016413 [Thalassiosira exigua]